MVTIILIAVTCLVSLLCFTETLNADKLLFHAYSVRHRKEWYRMLTYGLLFPLACRPDIFQHPLKPAEKFFEAEGEVPEWFKAGLEAALPARLGTRPRSSSSLAICSVFIPC